MGVTTDEIRKQALDAAGKLTDEELLEFISSLVDIHRGRAKVASYRAQQQFRTGDEVENVKHGRKLPIGARGHVTGLVGARELVHFPDFGTWQVDATTIRKVPAVAR